MRQTIGILGGGQLGQMMAISAQYMGHRVISLDPNPACSASKVSDQTIVADYDDRQALRQLAETSDLLTYEFENVDAASLHEVENKVRIPQSIRLLEITQNRRLEKEFIESSGLKVAPWLSIKGPEDLPSKITKKQVLKTSTGGYDGHGQLVLTPDTDLTEARDLAAYTDCVLEDFISFDKEISIIVSGNGRGDYVTFPVCENEHRHNILHLTIAPARISDELAIEARRIAFHLAEKLQLAGTLCVEMFLSKDNQIYINELAPRPHNSGHYTIEACDFSQFDLHIKGILGEPLPEPQLLEPTIMVNILGQQPQELAKLRPSWHLHDYGKAEAKPGRKMGHITILTKDFSKTLKEIDKL